MTERMPSPFDYDTNIARWRASRSIIRDYGTNGGFDVHVDIARKFEASGVRSVLDVGCGEGELARWLPPTIRWTGIDLSFVQVANAPRPVVRGNATSLPFRDDSFDAVAAIWMLYHLDEPSMALAEMRRVARPGGLVAVSAPSRVDSPELAHLFLPEPPSTFDAELAPGLVGQYFDNVEIDSWDGPYWLLPDTEAVTRALLGRGLPPDEASRRAATVDTPLSVTKRGAIVYGRKPPQRRIL